MCRDQLLLAAECVRGATVYEMGLSAGKFRRRLRKSVLLYRAARHRRPLSDLAPALPRLEDPRADTVASAAQAGRRGVRPAARRGHHAQPSTERAADVDSAAWAEGTGYAATPPDTVRRSIRLLPIDPVEFVFVNLGSGKGPGDARGVGVSLPGIPRRRVRYGSARSRGPETSPRSTATASFARRSEERRVGKECRSRWSPYH